MSRQRPVQQPGPGGTGQGHEWRTVAALRPRALPTDTSIRFLLLLAAVGAASLYLFDALWFVLRGEAFQDAVIACGMDASALASGSIADTSAELQAQAACRADVSREQTAFAIAGTAAVFALAYVAYRLLPWWRKKRSHLVPMDPVDSAAMLHEVEALSREAGLDRAPAVLVDAANPGVQAFVFGTTDRPQLGVTGGLVVQQVLDPPGFRAIVRHELAHLANRDVPWTFYTVTVWWTFVAVALAPVVVVLAISDPQYVLRLGWRTALLSGLVLLVRNAVLRAREAFADARAAEWGAGRDLYRLLESQPTTRGRRHDVLRLHPSPDTRRGLLADPDGLFRTDLFVALAAGVAAGTAFDSLGAILGLVAPQWVALWLAGLLVAVLLAAVMCVATWRTGLRSVVRATHVPTAAPLTLGVGVGLAAGPILSFQAAAGGLGDGPDAVLGYAVWVVGVVALTGLLARYATDTGRAAIEAGLRRTSPWRPLLIHGAAVVLALAAMLAFGRIALLVLTALGVPALGAMSIWAYTPFWLGPGSDALPVIGVVTMMTVAPLVARRMMRTPPEPVGAVTTESAGAWAWEEQPPPSLPRPAVPMLGPTFAMGALVGIVVVGWHIVARLVGAMVLDDAIWRSDAYRLALGQGTIFLIAAAAVIATAAAAFVIRRWWWPLGMLGGAAALLVGISGVLMANVAAGCGLLPRASAPDCSPPTMGALGTFGVMPLGLAVVWVAIAAAVVGVVRGITRGVAGAAEHRRWARFALAALGAAGVASLLGLGVVGVVAVTDVPTVQGPGYTLELPPTWQAARADGPVPQLSTINQRIRLELDPVRATLPAQGSETLDVGGVRAWFVGEQTDGQLVVRAYDLSAPSGEFRLFVIGSPVAIAESRDEEIADLLDGIQWVSAR